MFSDRAQIVEQVADIPAGESRCLLMLEQHGLVLEDERDGKRNPKRGLGPVEERQQAE